jgi:hypothetical protein
MSGDGQGNAHQRQPPSFGAGAVSLVSLVAIVVIAAGAPAANALVGFTIVLDFLAPCTARRQPIEVIIVIIILVVQFITG